MIILTKPNGERYYLNPGLIETIEASPDTIVTMTNGKKYFVLETADEVAARVEKFHVRVLARSRGVVELSKNNLVALDNDYDPEES